MRLKVPISFQPVLFLLMSVVFAFAYGGHSALALNMAPATGAISLAGIVIGDILSSPTIAPFPTIPELLALKMAYRNNALIADQVAPRIKVVSQKYAYLFYDKGDSFRIQDTKIGRKSQLNQVETNATLVNSATIPYGLKEMVPQADMDNAASMGMDPLAIATTMISGWVALDREKRVAKTVFDPNNFPVGNKVDQTNSAANQWDGADQTTTGNPVTQILTGLDHCIMRPRHMAIGRLAFSGLATNQSILKSVHGNLGDAGIASKQQIADLFELEDIYVGEAFLTTTKKGQAAAFDRVWGKSCLLFYKDTNLMQLDTGITFAFTAMWKQFAGAMPDKNIGPEGGQEVRAGEYVDEHLMAPDCGYLISGVVK